MPRRGLRVGVDEGGRQPGQRVQQGGVLRGDGGLVALDRGPGGVDDDSACPAWPAMAGSTASMSLRQISRAPAHGHTATGEEHLAPAARLDAKITAAKIATTLQALATPSRLMILTRLREAPCTVTHCPLRCHLLGRPFINCNHGYTEHVTGAVGYGESALVPALFAWEEVPVRRGGALQIDRTCFWLAGLAPGRPAAWRPAGYKLAVARHARPCG